MNIIENDLKSSKTKNAIFFDLPQLGSCSSTSRAVYVVIEDFLQIIIPSQIALITCTQYLVKLTEEFEMPCSPKLLITSAIEIRWRRKKDSMFCIYVI